MMAMTTNSSIKVNPLLGRLFDCDIFMNTVSPSIARDQNQPYQWHIVYTLYSCFSLATVRLKAQYRFSQDSRPLSSMPMNNLMCFASLQM